VGTWKSDISTRKAFQALLNKTPELVFIWGVLHGRASLQSLPTVMDEMDRIFVANTNWSAFVHRRGQDCFALVAVVRRDDLKSIATCTSL
jgi:hypothetical protein